MCKTKTVGFNWHHASAKLANCCCGGKQGRCPTCGARLTASAMEASAVQLEKFILPFTAHLHDQLCCMEPELKQDLG